MKALADEHVPFAIVQGLRTRGMDVVTVQDRGQESTSDAMLLAQSLEEERVVLRTDHHFLALASHHASAGQRFAPIF